MQGIKYAFQAAKAYVEGHSQKQDEKQTGKVHIL